MSPSPLRVVTDDDRLLFDAQCRRRSAFEFIERFGPYLERISRKLATKRAASDADREDAVQECYCFIFGGGGARYQPGRSAARTYLYFALQSAFNVAHPRRRRCEAPLPTNSDGTVNDEVLVEYATVEPTQEFETREFIEHLLRDVTLDDRILLEGVANDRTLLDLGLERGLSRPTMSRKFTALCVRLRTRAAAAMTG